MGKQTEKLKVTDQELEATDDSLHENIDMKLAEPATSRMEYKDLFDNMPNGCAYYKVIFDEDAKPVDLKYLKVNSAYVENIGRPLPELIGKGVTEVFPHLTKASLQWMKKYIQVALFGKPVAFTQYFDHQDKWYSISAYSPQRDYIVEISEDITERKRSEAKVEQYVAELAERNVALNTSQSRYQGLLDHMHHIFEYHRVITDENDRPVDLEFAEVNPAFEMQTGLKIADVVGKRLPVITHGIDKTYWIQVLGEVALTGQPMIVEQYVEKTDTWYRVSAYSPEKGYVASILEDITQQRKVEVQKSENQRQVAMIEKVASLGALATGVAYEINQPLQALKIMADGMIYWYDKGKETSMEKVIENCRRISVQVGYITTIVEWMQDFVNKAWSDKPEAVDLNKMIKQALNMVQERLKNHNIQVYEHTAAFSPTVWGDSRRLREIIIIILVNAMESLAGVDQGTKEIGITTSCVGEKAVIEISNNGPVISDEIIGKIFEPFFSSSRSGANLGMGLTIVKSIVDGHNGTIQAFSVNQQVRFRIEFPRYVEEA